MRTSSRPLRIRPVRICLGAAMLFLLWAFEAVHPLRDVVLTR